MIKDKLLFHVYPNELRVFYTCKKAEFKVDGTTYKNIFNGSLKYHFQNIFRRIKKEICS